MSRAIRQARRPHWRRNGKSLIEAMVIISMMSLILGLAATSLATLFRLRYVMVRDAEQAASLDRLAMRLRQDAHEAVSASVFGDGTRSVPTTSSGCELKMADGRAIRYSFAAQRVVREVLRDDKVVHRDTFSLTRHEVVVFDKDKTDGGSLVRITMKPEETKLPPRELPRWAMIEAAVGIHGVLAKAEAR